MVSIGLYVRDANTLISLQGASITLHSDSLGTYNQVTDQYGMAYFDVPAGWYSSLAVMEGYKDHMGSFNAQEGDPNRTISLYPLEVGEVQEIAFFGWEEGDINTPPSWMNTGGTREVVTSPVYEGVYAARFHHPDAYSFSGVGYRLPAPVSNIIVEFAYMVDYIEPVSSSEQRFMRINRVVGDARTMIVELFLAAGLVRAIDDSGSTTSYRSTQPNVYLEPGVWYKFTAQIYGGRFTLWINDVQVMTWMLNAYNEGTLVEDYEHIYLGHLWSDVPDNTYVDNLRVSTWVEAETPPLPETRTVTINCALPIQVTVQGVPYPVGAVLEFELGSLIVIIIPPYAQHNGKNYELVEVLVNGLPVGISEFQFLLDEEVTIEPLYMELEEPPTNGEEPPTNGEEPQVNMVPWVIGGVALYAILKR